MKVFFDHQIFLTQQVGGISRYFFNLKNALLANRYCEVDNWSCIYRNSYFGPDNGMLYIKKSNYRFVNDLLKKGKVLKAFNSINEKITLNRIDKCDFDVIHLTDNNADYINKVKKRKPVVVTVHDLIPELYPNYFPDIKSRLNDREKTFKLADHLICISESTRRDLKEIYGFADDHITMIHHGSADYMIKDKDFKFINPKTQQKQRYVLYIGDRKANYKNFGPMLKNLSAIFAQDRELNLLCVGAPFSNAEKAMIGQLNLTSVVSSVQADENELFSIYENALCLIIPSLYEGFGFPMLEAMKAGCPVLSSDASSLPEVGGDSAQYFDATDFNHFGDKLYDLITNADRIANIKMKQIDDLKKFSWQNTALKTYNVYKSLV